MRRRAFFAFTSALAFGAGGAATAQLQQRRYRIGMLGGNPTAQPAQFDRLKRRLAELGYVDGRDIVFERRFHRGRIEQVPELAAELVQLRPDVIVATGPEAVLKAVSSATANIPIVFVAVDLLELDGQPLLDVPLLERKRLLDAVVEDGPLARRGMHIRPPIGTWISTWRALGFRAIAYKSANSRYRPGEPNDDWATAPLPIR